MVRLVKLFSVIFLGIVISSCTRKMDEQAQLSFNISGMMKSSSKGLSAQSEDDDGGVNFIAINVKGPNKVFKCTMDAGGDEEREGLPPFDNPKCVLGESVNSATGEIDYFVNVNESFNANISYNIQVLLIEEVDDGDNGEGVEYFNYGEGSTRKVGDSLVADVIAREDQASGAGVEGSVSGRYLLDDAVPYTGKVKLEYVPLTGSEPMEIFDLFMINGYFELFVFKDIQLQYRMVDRDDKHVMFNGPITLNSPSIQASGTHVAKIEGPETFYSGGGGPDSGSNDPWNQVLGFWNNGLPDTSGQVCIDSTGHTSGHVFTDSGLSNGLVWPNDFITVGGDSCSMADPIVTESVITVDGELMANGGGARVFYGPFMKMDSGYGTYNLLNHEKSGSDLILSWKYLPGTSNLVAGAAIFFKEADVSDSLKDHHDGGQGFNCQDLPSDWERIDVGSGVESVTLYDVASDLLTEGKVFVCPMKVAFASDESPFFPTVLETNAYDSYEGGGSSETEGKPAVELEISTGNGGMFPYINNGTCTKVEVVALDEDDSHGMLPEFPYTVSLSQSEGSFYIDGSCGAPLTGNKIDMYNSYAIAWYKSTMNTTNAAWEASADPSNSEIIASSGSVSIAVQTAGTASQLSVEASLEVYSTDCVDLLFVLEDANYVPVSYAGSQLDVSLFDSSGNGAFFDDDECTSSGSMIAITTGMAYGISTYNPSASDDGQTITISMTSSPEPYTNHSVNMTVYDPGPATYAIVEDLSNPFEDTCDSFYIRTYAERLITYKDSPSAYPASTLNYNLEAEDENGNPVSLNFFNSQTDCNNDTPAITSYSQDNSTLMKEIFYKTTETGGTKIYISIDEQNNGSTFDNVSKEIEVQ